MTTLARLSFWVPHERMDEFASAYAKQLAPILAKHDLVETSKSVRIVVDGIFSRLFELPSPDAVASLKQQLHQNPTWRETLTNLGTIFGTTFTAQHPDGIERYYRYLAATVVVEMAPLLRYHFELYATAAGPGTAVEAGTGFRQGMWQN